MSKSSRLSDEVPVDWGKLLESQLERWRSGGSHGRGIAEYISNSDDSYRRLKRFSGQPIQVEIYSKRGRHIDKLIIRDFAEGMSYEDLENKFFRYFESASGRAQGELVTGRFGTGGKAYAIMNFEQCWIISVRDGLESKAWFKWDRNRKRIVRNYSSGGYRSQPVEKPNQTIIELEHSLKVNPDLMELVASLGRLPRIRHVVKNQQVTVSLFKMHERSDVVLKYVGPTEPLRVWTFPVPKELCDGEQEPPSLTLRYFQRPLGEENFIDLNDGISSVADETVGRFDNRPFSRYFNGSLTLQRLKYSSAVKENRLGLEQEDDLTKMIESFIKDCVCPAVSEVEDEQLGKERQRRLSASNEKMKELSKFLQKCDASFKLELDKIEKKPVVDSTPYETIPTDNETQSLATPILEDELSRSGDDEVNGRAPEIENLRTVLHFIGKDDKDFSNALTRAWQIWSNMVRVSDKPDKIERRKNRDRLRVLMSDDPNVSEEDRRVFGEFDDPVNDLDMIGKKIIWINANHPLILARRTESENDPVFLEMVANYVLMVLAQHQAQRHHAAEPEEEKSDPLLLFREKFFKLQRELHEDNEVSYFNTSDNS